MNVRTQIWQTKTPFDVLDVQTAFFAVPGD